MDTKLGLYRVNLCCQTCFLQKLFDVQETSASWEDIKYESVTGFTVEVNHIRSSLKSLIAIQVIGFCRSHPMTETPTLKSMKKQLYALLLNCYEGFII